MAERGFRRFLRRAKPVIAEAELDEATPTAPFAGTARSALAVPLSDVSIDKKSEPASLRAPLTSVAKSRKEAPRSRSGYVWRSERYRNSIFDMRF